MRTSWYVIDDTHELVTHELEERKSRKLIKLKSTLKVISIHLPSDLHATVGLALDKLQRKNYQVWQSVISAQW